MSTDLTAEGFAETLTGFEEIAITKQFGKEVSDLPGTMAGRAMVFTSLTRDGLSADDAYKGAMEMPLKTVTEFFAEDEEITPDSPTTDPGKDSEPSDSEPTT